MTREAIVGFENSKLNGITIKNMIVTVICTASIVATVLGTYYTQQKDNAILDLRIKILEAQVIIINQQVSAIQQAKK